MPKFDVCVECRVFARIEVEVDDKDDAIEAAQEVFDGLDSYVGNGSSGGKLLGTNEESVYLVADEVVDWDTAEVSQKDV